jgi:hypothetical protein
MGAAWARSRTCRGAQPGGGGTQRAAVSAEQRAVPWRPAGFCVAARAPRVRSDALSVPWSAHAITMASAAASPRPSAPFSLLASSALMWLRARNQASAANAVHSRATAPHVRGDLAERSARLFQLNKAPLAAVLARRTHARTHACTHARTHARMHAHRAHASAAAASTSRLSSSFRWSSPRSTVLLLAVCDCARSGEAGVVLAADGGACVVRSSGASVHARHHLLLRGEQALAA